MNTNLGNRVTREMAVTAANVMRIGRTVISTL